MENSTTLFLNKIEECISYHHDFFSDLPFSQKKIVLSLFLHQLSLYDKMEYLQEAIFHMQDQFSSGILEALDNKTTFFDPLSEIHDELILKLIDQCEDEIQTYFDEIIERRMGDYSYLSEINYDNIQRTRDMKAELER